MGEFCGTVVGLLDSFAFVGCINDSEAIMIRCGTKADARIFRLSSNSLLVAQTKGYAFKPFYHNGFTVVDTADKCQNLSTNLPLL